MPTPRPLAADREQAAAGEERGAPSAPESATEAQLYETATEVATTATAISAEPSIHSFPPAVPDPGTFLHGLLEWAAEQGFADLTVTIVGVRTRLPSIASAAIMGTGRV